jgi:hypothetical protein
VFKGESREYMLSMIDAVKMDRRDETLRKYLSAGDAAYQISNLVTSDLNDYNADLRVSYDVVQKGALARFGTEQYLNLDNRKDFEDYKVDTTKRRLPICFPYKDHKILDVRVTLPDGAKAKSLPGPISLRRDDYGYNGAWVEQQGIINYHSESWMERTLYPVTQFPILNRDVQIVKNFYSTQPELNF